jgi:hypothetical protein
MNDIIKTTIPLLRSKIDACDPSLLTRLPISDCIASFDEYPAWRSYSYLLPATENIFEAIFRTAGNVILTTYLKLLLLQLISISRPKVDTSNLPIQIKRLYAQNFSRIEEDIVLDRQPMEHYTPRSDKFLKDLSISNLLLIPAGAQKVHKDIIPFRDLIRKQRIGETIQTISFIMRRIGFDSPVLRMHTDSHDPDLMAEFSPEGWTRFYSNAASIMDIQTDIQGLLGIGWFFDPQVPKISPRLTYLGDLVLATGGYTFRVGAGEGARESALATSPTRRKLYEEGKYVPTDYLAIWDRTSLLKWARHLQNKSSI